MHSLNFIRNLLDTEFKNAMLKTYKNFFLKEINIALNDLYVIFSEQVGCLEIESEIVKNINTEIKFIKF